VKIKLPGANSKEMNLDINTNRLILTTPKYKLYLHLPHKVEHEKGKAKFDSDKSLLDLTLPVLRDD